MFKIQNGIIHGSSFALPMNGIEFITWRLNEDNGLYWVKMHLPSGKEIRIKVSESELRKIVNVWNDKDIVLKLGDYNELDY